MDGNRFRGPTLTKKQSAVLAAVIVAMLDHFLIVRPSEQQSDQTAHALREVARLVASQRSQLERYEYMVCIPPSPR